MAKFAFTDSFLPTLSSHDESQQSLWGHFGALIRRHGVPNCSQRPLRLVLCSRPTVAVLSSTEKTTWLLVFSGSLSPPNFLLPPAPPPLTHPPTLLYTTFVILQEVFKTSQKSAISTSSQLFHMLCGYNYFRCKSSVATCIREL